MDGVRIGTSGWTYGHWVGVLYPEGLPRSRWRDAYVEHFDTVELNASYHRWPGERPFRSWGEQLPEGFTMSVKASRWITHGRRLDDPEGAWAHRLTTAMKLLGPRAGVLLLQLPGDFERDDERLDRFLSQLPRDLPVAAELRHRSWDHDDVARILERHRAAFVVTHGEGLHTVERVTAPFVYLRWHGDPLYAGAYSRRRLRRWADRIREWHTDGREVWGYFDNDGSGHAVRDADTLRRLLGEDPPPTIGA